MQDAEREQQRDAGRRRRGRQQLRGWASHEGDGGDMSCEGVDGGDMSCEGVDGKYIGKMQLGTSTGPSTRGS